MISINPFSENRAELLSDLWKYYVPFEEIDIDDSKPIQLLRISSIAHVNEQRVV